VPNNQHLARSSLTITLAVWKALFLREALSRIFSGRAAWFWLLAEPVIGIVFLIIIFTVIRMRVVGGMDIAIWLTLGMLGFFMFQRTAMQVMNAIGANRVLLAYRQVKLIDTLIARAVLEGFLMIFISYILLAGLSLFGYSVMPDDPLLMGGAFFGLWCTGIGFGLIASVVITLIPGLKKVVKFTLGPMKILSGVIFPISSMPPQIREWLMLNPVAHALEAIRLGFSPYYHAVPELSVIYIFICALVTVFFGLALHRRFALRLVAK